MSYSRWGNSHWYTYWRVQPDGQKETRCSAIFEICGVGSFSANRLRTELDSCIQEITAVDPDGDIDELKEYIATFLSDVDRKHTPESRE